MGVIRRHNAIQHMHKRSVTAWCGGKERVRERKLVTREDGGRRDPHPWFKPSVGDRVPSPRAAIFNLITILRLIKQPKSPSFKHCFNSAAINGYWQGLKIHNEDIMSRGFNTIIDDVFSGIAVIILAFTPVVMREEVMCLFKCDTHHRNIFKRWTQSYRTRRALQLPGKGFYFYFLYELISLSWSPEVR